jgi:hypothetical protein
MMIFSGPGSNTRWYLVVTGTTLTPPGESLYLHQSASFGKMIFIGACSNILPILPDPHSPRETVYICIFSFLSFSF